MNEILSYFFRPEESVSTLLIEKNKDKWKQGVLSWIMSAILLGFLTMAVYRLNVISIVDILVDILGSNNESLIQSILYMQVNEGVVWLISAIILILKVIIMVGFKFILWAVALYIASCILKQRLKLYDVVLLSIFAMSNWLAAQIFTIITLMIASICPIDIINQMLVGLSMILGYWYLIILAIGFAIQTRSTFLKGGLVILTVQCTCWILASLVPTLQIVLG